MKRESVVRVAREALVLGGVVLISVGAGMAYLPAGFIVGGALMLYAGARGVL